MTTLMCSDIYKNIANPHQTCKVHIHIVIFSLFLHKIGKARIAIMWWRFTWHYGRCITHSFIIYQLTTGNVISQFYVNYISRILTLWHTFLFLIKMPIFPSRLRHYGCIHVSMLDYKSFLMFNLTYTSFDH